MSEFLKAVILGVVEGVTEFLPISSTGHLIIVNQWLSFGPDFTPIFDVVIQLGAILAVVVCFWDRLWPFSGPIFKKDGIYTTWKKVLIGILPALVLGFLFGDDIQERLFDPVTVATMLILGGLLLLVVERVKVEERIHTISEVSYTTALLIGFAQAVAMIPGTSRSAATIIGGLMLGLGRVTATEFSFFLAIPTMAAASGYALLKAEFAFGSQEMMMLAVGFLTSFLVAWLVIKTFMAYVQNHDFRYFGYYRIALGLLVLVYFFEW